MTILAIESAGSVASVAIAKDNTIIGEYSINTKMTHSETLLPMTDELIRNVGINVSDIDYVAVSIGPGSFTGLRIGISEAKALAYAYKKPTVAVPTLKALACIGVRDGIICSVMDARRGHVYCGLYEYEREKLGAHNSEYRLINVENDMLISAEELVDKLGTYGRAVTFVGDGVNVLKGVLSEATFDYSFALPIEADLSASKVAYVAGLMVKSGDVTTASRINAEYLRPSQAERTKEAKDNFVIREITVSDAERLASIEAVSIGNGAWSQDSLKDAVTKDNAIYLVAYSKDELCGFVGAWLSVDEAEITNVAISPDYRRKGIATALLRELMTRCRGNGVNRFILEVRKSNNRAIKLYESLNFKLAGERRNFYSNPREDALIYVNCGL